MNLLPFSWARIVSDKKYMRFFQILAWKIVESIFLFTITEGRLVHTSHPRKGVSMEIKFKRKITSEMMTTFNPSLDDHLCHHILQAFLLWGSLEREPDHHAGDDHHLHEQDGKPSPHLRHQDDWHLADLLPNLSFCWGCLAHRYGISKSRGKWQKEKEEKKKI